jgi:hypothetical protein
MEFNLGAEEEILKDIPAINRPNVRMTVYVNADHMIL